MYKNEQLIYAKSTISAKNGVGIAIDTKKSMVRTSYRQVLLIIGIIVAFIVILLFNSEIYSPEISKVDSSLYKINELAHYSIPSIFIF